MSDDHFLNLQPGTIVNGRYEIVKCLGTGSMGMVYACRHRELAGHMVAMKVLFSEVARDEIAAARFRNEIVAAYGVSHPNVVRAYEYFRDGDLIAFTMEFIGGGDLADRLGGDSLLSINEIIELLIQMCSGVQAIHDAGIVHRDLKPENILITSQGNIKITDFGIARMGTGPKLTEHGGVVGTIDYVSPEYIGRSQVDSRSDIYALGVLAYEMVTGEVPFKGKCIIDIMTMRLHVDPTNPSSKRADCPEELGNIILKALQREPEDRYQNASEMHEDLQALKRSRMPSDDMSASSVRTSSVRHLSSSAHGYSQNGDSHGSDSHGVADGRTTNEILGRKVQIVDKGKSHDHVDQGVDVRNSSGSQNRREKTTQASQLFKSKGDSPVDATNNKKSSSSHNSSLRFQPEGTLSHVESRLKKDVDSAVAGGQDPYLGHGHIDKMERVLAGTQRPGSGAIHRRGEQERDANFSVSQSHLSVQRISQLNQNLKLSPKHSRAYGQLMLYLAIIGIGFCFGLLVLQKYYPRYF